MNVYLPNLRLPSEYQEVEWIQNSSSWYINTWYVPTANTKIKWKFNVTSVTHTDWMSLRWLMDSSNVRYCSWYYNNGNYWFWFWTLNGSWNAQYAGTTWTTFEVENYAQSWTAYNIVNWVSKTETWYTYSGTTYTMYLFTRHRPDSELRWTVKIYYFKIYDNWTLVRDFVPCYRKSDNVIGLYDLVNNQFYTNAWTGTFSKGNDVTMTELKNDYIGEYTWTVQTFDFQNDWELWWTKVSWSYWTAWYTAWQWLYWRLNSSSNAANGDFYPPSSVYNDEILKKIRIWYYLPSANIWVWPLWKNSGWTQARWPLYRCWRNQAQTIWFWEVSSTYQQIWNITGEILLEVNIEENKVFWKVNNVNYSITTNLAKLLIDGWANKHLHITPLALYDTSMTYIRKVEFTTEQN